MSVIVSNDSRNCQIGEITNPGKVITLFSLKILSDASGFAKYIFVWSVCNLFAGIYLTGRTSPCRDIPTILFDDLFINITRFGRKERRPITVLSQRLRE